MSDLKKWKEEFARYEVELMNGAYVTNEMIYISACKAREKELQEAKAKLEKAESFISNLKSKKRLEENSSYIEYHSQYSDPPFRTDLVPRHGSEWIGEQVRQYFKDKQGSEK